MRKGFFRKTLVYITTLTFILTVFPSLTFNAIAEDPPEPPIQGWYVEGNGTYFEITNSSYLNITLSSTENIHIYLESIPNSIFYYIKSNCSANSTLITLTGFEINETYYQYQDGILIGNFTIDETGSYSYTQDLENYHNVLIQNYTSTIVIKADGTISPPWANIQYVGNNK